MPGLIEALRARLLPTPAARWLAQDEYAVSLAFGAVRRRWPWLRLDRIRWAALAFIPLLVIGLRAYASARDADPVTEFAIAQVGDIALFSLGMGILFSHLWMIGQALRMGGISLSRERDGRVWDLLVLTGVRARDVVIGKWVGLMRALWRQFRDLLFWRAAAAFVVGGVLIINDAPLQTGVIPDPLIPALPALLLLAICIALLGAINLLLALGAGMAGSALTRTIIGGMRMAALTYLTGAVIIGFLFVSVVSLRPRPLPPPVQDAVRLLIVSLLDGGSLASLSLLYPEDLLPTAILAIAIGLPLFSAISAASLLLCIRLTVERGASA
ncbi:MAG: hypothetical protein ACUVS2_03270 [Candidatus Flexifilum sp.]